MDGTSEYHQVQNLQPLRKKIIWYTMKQSPSCPLCEQNLSAARKRFLKNKFETDVAVLTHRFARLSNVIKSLKVILFEQHATLEKLKKEDQEAQLITHKIPEHTSSLIRKL